MEVGGLMGEAFKAFLGNPDVMAALLTFCVVVTILLTIIEVFKSTKL